MFIHKGYVTLVDEHRLEELRQFTWYVDRAGKKIYVKRRYRVDGVNKTEYLHRRIMGVTDGKIKVDHQFGDTLDNRECVLRVCTNSDNCRNSERHCDSRSKYKGVVTSVSGNRFYARINFEGSCIGLGAFKTEDDAAIAYNIKAKELFGEFANLNPVDDLDCISPEKVRPNNKSGYIGVCFRVQNGKWCAEIQSGPTKYYLGVYTSAIDAARAYDAKAIELHGPSYHKLNFPPNP